MAGNVAPPGGSDFTFFPFYFWFAPEENIKQFPKLGVATPRPHLQLRSPEKLTLYLSFILQINYQKDRILRA